MADSQSRNMRAFVEAESDLIRRTATLLTRESQRGIELADNALSRTTLDWDRARDTGPERTYALTTLARKRAKWPLLQKLLPNFKSRPSLAAISTRANVNPEFLRRFDRLSPNEQDLLTLVLYSNLDPIDAGKALRIPNPEQASTEALAQLANEGVPVDREYVRKQLRIIASSLRVGSVNPSVVLTQMRAARLKRNTVRAGAATGAIGALVVVLILASQYLRGAERSPDSEFTDSEGQALADACSRYASESSASQASETTFVVAKNRSTAAAVSRTEAEAFLCVSTYSDKTQAYAFPIPVTNLPAKNVRRSDWVAVADRGGLNYIVALNAVGIGRIAVANGEQIRQRTTKTLGVGVLTRRSLIPDGDELDFALFDLNDCLCSAEPRLSETNFADIASGTPVVVAQ